MGFLKKFVKKAGRVVTTKSKTTRGVLKVGLPIVGGVMLGGTALALFAARSFGQNSQQNAEELPGESLDEYYARQQGMFSRYGGFSEWAQQGLFKLGRSGVKRLTESGLPSKEAVATAAGAGVATGGGACAAQFVVETVCRLCGG